MLLDAHKGLLEKLIPVYDSEDFEDVFQMMTDGEDGPTKLKIKMELHRIMAPCRQIVDLRGKVKGECRPYELDGLTHWLDDVAINTYHKRIKVFGGKFRLGLYEALMNTRNNFRVLHQQQKLSPQQEAPIEQRDTQFDAPVIRFGHYLTRGENRLQLATSVNLELPFNQTVNGITSDISYSGAKFKVPAAFKYNLGMSITARFPKLAEVLNEPRLNQGIDYRILGIDESKENDSFKWLRLKITSDNTLIKWAIEQSLWATRHRTRKNHEDKVIKTRTKGYEHCFLKHSASMPLFFAGSTLKYCLLTQHNKHLWDDWHDERNQPVINHLLSEDRMASLGKAGLKQCSTLLYSFRHDHDGKSYFYSAALPEMTIEQRHLFWHIGAPRSSWRVSRLTVQPIEQEDIERLKEIAPEMVEQMGSLTHIGLLQDLTNSKANQDYRLAVKPQLTGKALQAFRHQRNPIAKAKAVYFDPKPQRCEARFLLDTEVIFHHPSHAAVKGKTVDFSARGLNLQLDTPLPACRDDEVTVSFPQLERLDKKTVLGSIPYKVIRVSPDHLNIQLTTGSGAQAAQGEHFLRKLIQHNENKLVMTEEKLPTGELLMAMHQMLLSRLNSVPYFGEKVDHKVRVKAIGCNFPLPPIARLLNQVGGEDRFSVEPLFKNRVKQMLAETMRPVEVRQPYIHELYLWVQRKGDSISHIESKLINDFNSIDERINFIKGAKKHGEFMAIRVTAVPVLSPMTALIGKELGELARMTLHRARALEEELSSLIGCGELHDITDEVLVRLEIK
ncbi:PilZ domain-containing protein [Photobacterium sanctipauli]|uniref:PilZ domain-containing protein n=1 Tax=Photobacterium sanctipauli TaxID=1342794 RepID=A0A2T3NRQ3_9GAMM|nr:PilZ domain-containing protein [Photobacterium sanctipauli]PSW18928.1 PilZ domain-containing protein [Photobacterium sanctipauli]